MRIQKREHNRKTLGRIAKGMLTAACMAVMLWGMPIISLADATGKVIPNSVNIRKSPDVNSEVVGSSTVGKTVTIKGKVSASGTTWYQVYVQADKVGYIRADMLEAEAGADIPTVSAEGSSSDSSSASSEASSDAAVQADTSSGGASVAADESVDLQYAKIKVNCKVRPEPTTKKNPVGALTEGAQVVVSGKSAGSDGKTWYYVTYTSDSGSEKTGFVREDLLEMGDLVPVEEEAPPEEAPQETQEPEPAVNNDYELRVEQTENGPVWYLDDHIHGDAREVTALLEAADSQNQGEEETADAVVKQRIVIVILGVVLAALIVTVVIMAFKLRDAYYEDYEDDDEEDEEEEDEEEEDRPARRRMRGEEAEEDRPIRRREMPEADTRRRNSERSVRNERGERRTSRERSYEEDQMPDRGAKAAPKRKSKNFLLDDDEFEFEFLNMDDKDLM